MAKNGKTAKAINNQGPAGFVFLLAYIGAAVYFVRQSEGFSGFIWALIKAIAWPAIATYNLFEFLKI